VGVLGWIGLGAVAVVVIGWLWVSFAKPGRQRDAAAWIATLSLYVALLSLFVHLTSRALANDSTAGLIGFGFLASMFAIGLVLALARTVGTLRGRASRDTSATN
jgi:hypothetical protein